MIQIEIIVYIDGLLVGSFHDVASRGSQIDPPYVLWHFSEDAQPPNSILFALAIQESDLRGKFENFLVSLVSHLGNVSLSSLIVLIQSIEQRRHKFSSSFKYHLMISAIFHFRLSAHSINTQKHKQTDT
jgi:hypothetical protein